MSAGEGRTVTVTVSPDMSPLDIGKLFEGRGLVRDARLFALQYYLSEYREDVGPGTFDLSTAMTAEEMMQAMVVAHKRKAKGIPQEGEAPPARENLPRRAARPPGEERPAERTAQGMRPGMG